ncbi:HET-domain-containing protein [Xylaria castorea]|nr:HET-domain-containing protein [Xylaria castorea]
MPPAYQYMPLPADDDNDSIRVLELLPGTFDNPVIYVKLRSTNVEAVRFKFEAVSYTWGDPTPCKIIVFEESNARLQVSRNCYSVLRHLRNPVETRTLWIDAICINQADIPERNSQVLIMGLIYAAAIHTAVFLGYSTPGSQLLFRHLARTDRLRSLGEEQRAESLPRPTEKVIRELEHLLKRSWFSRVWVIQEVMRSFRVTFMCGRDTATIEALTSCLYGNVTQMRVLSKFPAPLELDHESFRENLKRCSTPARKIYFLAAGAGLCESTDPRDRILALTPLCGGVSPEIDGLVDYEQETESIFRKFALLFLQDGGLALLWMIRHPHLREMPSWVPDWTENRGKSHRTLQIPDFFDAYDSNQLSGDYKDFHIGSIDDIQSSAPQCLVISGERYGRIQELGPIIHIKNEDIQTRIKSVRSLIDELESMRHGSNLPNWPDSIVQAFQHLTIDDIHDLFGTMCEMKPIEVNQELSFNVAIACHESRVFITSKGELGLSSKALQHGDLVCLVKGAIEPCVLRERDHRQWTIISGACVLLDIERGYRKAKLDWTWRYMNQIIPGPRERFMIC